MNKQLIINISAGVASAVIAAIIIKKLKLRTAQDV